MSDHADDYLWDRSGEPDPDVAALERLLGRYAHGENAPAAGPRRWAVLPWLLLPLAAAVVVGAFLWPDVFLPSGRGDVPRVFDGDGVRLAVTEGRIVADDGGFRAETTSTLELVETDEDGEEEWIGDFTFEPDSRASVGMLSRDVTRLGLRQGRMLASVSADARPRFVQVDTPSGRCIDLGCRYELEVDANGDAHIEVTLGQVAFTNVDGRERYVPAGARCVARQTSGLGTPRFPDVTGGFDDRLDAFDGAAGDDATARRAAARRVAEAAADEKDTLALWHLLDDADAVVRDVAAGALMRIAGRPPVTRKMMKGAVFTRAEWREHLEDLWW